jgi:hypothetical protein
VSLVKRIGANLNFSYLARLLLTESELSQWRAR